MAKQITRGRPVSCSEFTRFLIDQQPSYDREILKDIRPEDPSHWIGRVRTKVEVIEEKIPPTKYQITLYSVRKLSEGLAFERLKLKTRKVTTRDPLVGRVNVGPFDPYTSAEHTWNRFYKNFPKIKCR